ATFARIVGRYDLMTRLMTLGRDRSWRRAAVHALAPTPGLRALDVGCGTGDLTLELAAAGPRLVVGLDPVPAMLDAAAAKAQAARSIGERRAARSAGADSVALVAGDALALPFPDASFQVVA